ncbi:uncharacterized protein isoform X1 [Rhodnius prolixus]|uniref:uncharacterized protein isoform X1 n=1 Tax=Rhodnius prolixus TaxID=13249 RepID=UPI003D188EEB
MQMSTLTLYRNTVRCQNRTMLLFVAVILLLLDVRDLVTSQLTCSDIEKKGSGAAFDLEQLKELSKIDPEDLNKCFVLLGKEPLVPEKASALWASIVYLFGSAEDIPEERLQQLGWISSGIPSEQFMNLSYTDVDTVAAFGKATHLSKEQLVNLKEAVMEQWCGKNEEDLTGYDLAVLRQILCAFNASSVQMIHPVSYKEAAGELSTLFNCSEEVMKELARLAMDEDAFGNPSSWTSIQLANVGCVITGLDLVSVVPAIAMEGLTPDIIKCLPANVLKAMTEEQIRNLAPAAAFSLTKEQVAALDNNKKSALQQAITGVNARENGKSGACLMLSSTIIIYFCFLIIRVSETFLLTVLNRKSHL